MRCLWIMFVTAVCFLFLYKLKWPKNKNIYDDSMMFFYICGKFHTDMINQTVIRKECVKLVEENENYFEPP